ncbi:unnamed protein product, partial [Prorocentrum cordatum]
GGQERRRRGSRCCAGGPAGRRGGQGRLVQVVLVDRLGRCAAAADVRLLWARGGERPPRRRGRRVVLRPLLGKMGRRQRGTPRGAPSALVCSRGPEVGLGRPGGEHQRLHRVLQGWPPGHHVGRWHVEGGRRGDGGCVRLPSAAVEVAADQTRLQVRPPPGQRRGLHPRVAALRGRRPGAAAGASRGDGARAGRGCGNSSDSQPRRCCGAWPRRAGPRGRPGRGLAAGQPTLSSSLPSPSRSLSSSCQGNEEAQ